MFGWTVLRLEEDIRDIIAAEFDEGQVIILDGISDY